MANELVHRALVFASRAHEGQDRRYTGDPYIVHPIAVMQIVREARGTDIMMAAALLHDVVEDSPVTLSEIEDAFGSEVAQLVDWLTDVATDTDGNRTERARINRQHTAEAPAAAHTIKLADLIHNTESIVEHDPRFAQVYMHEKRQLLKVLTKGNPGLMKVARSRLDEWAAQRSDEG